MLNKYNGLHTPIPIRRDIGEVLDNITGPPGALCSRVTRARGIGLETEFFMTLHVYNRGFRP
jgi:hypothetical protein